MPKHGCHVIGHTREHQIEFGAAAVNLQFQITLRATAPITVTSLNQHTALAAVANFARAITAEAQAVPVGLQAKISGFGQIRQQQLKWQGLVRWKELIHGSIDGADRTDQQLQITSAKTWIAATEITKLGVENLQTGNTSRIKAHREANWRGTHTWR